MTALDSYRGAPAGNPPRTRHWLGESLATIAAPVLVLLRDRFARVTVEPRWHPHKFAARSTAANIPGTASLDRARRADAADRAFAVGTMIVAASLAVAVSVVVAPRLRSGARAIEPEPAALVAQGAAVYGTTCAGCHGADLKGGAASAAGLPPPPLDASGHAWLHSDATLFRMVKFGIANCLGGSSTPQMPSFDGRLDDRSIHAALTFVKSRWPADVRLVQNAFNDGESDGAETQEAVLCTAICQPPAATATTPPGSNGTAR